MDNEDVYILDEFHSFVDKKGNKKRLFNIFGFNTGKVYRHTRWDRSFKTMDKFFKSLWHLTKKIRVLCIDHRDAFEKAAKKYGVEVVIGKEYTWKLERFHLSIRTAIARFVRRWIRYSKKLDRQKKVYWHYLYYYNTTH